MNANNGKNILSETGTSAEWHDRPGPSIGDGSDSGERLVKLKQQINHQSCWRFNSSFQCALSCLPYTIPTSSNKLEKNRRNIFQPIFARPRPPHTHIRTSVLGDSIFNGKLLLSHAHGLREAAFQSRTTQRLNAILWLPGFNQSVYINK